MSQIGKVVIAAVYLSVGACVSGTISGTGGHADRNCTEEVCDGFDNDCDGQVDEDCSCDDGSQQECYSGNPISVDIGECHRGIQTCSESRWGDCVGEVVPVLETCDDGFDNSCDGRVDEECPCDEGTEKWCYSGNPITVDIGECQRGNQLCVGGTWGACEGEVLPGEELCDEVDNSCDGVVDEGCPCDDGSSRSCYTGDPATEGIGECSPGTQTCSSGTWGPCDGDVTPVEEICNGIDDDCDGVADDEHPDVMCPGVVHGTVDCQAGICVVNGCDADYYDINGDFNDGCECLADPTPVGSGGQCASPIDLGVLTDSNGDSVNVTGNGALAGREIWWSFSAVDDADTAGDEFHVDVRFANNPGDAYDVTVYRAGCAGSDEVSPPQTDLVDWYTDQNYTTTGCGPGPGPPCGEGNCVSGAPQPGENTCDDDTATFYVRVRRISGQASCEPFSLEISNGIYSG